MKEDLVAELLAATEKSLFGIIFLSIAFLFVSQLYLRLQTPIMLALNLIVLIFLFLNTTLFLKFMLSGKIGIKKHEHTMGIFLLKRKISKK